MSKAGVEEPKSSSFRERSRSPPRSSRPRHEGHECWIAISLEQKENIESTGKLTKASFGNGWCVPVKNTVEDALQAFVLVSNGTPPECVVRFKIPLDKYYEWMHNRSMQIAAPHLNGYRINQDIVLFEVDPNWNFHYITNIAPPRSMQED